MHSIAQKIDSLQRQLAIRERGVALCNTLATLIAAASVLGTVDYLVQFSDPGLRIMATVALVLTGVWALYRWWYLPSRSPLAPLTVARRVETHFPQLKDSLASALEFLKESEDDRTAGSAQLRRLVVAEAANSIEGLPLEEVIDRRPLRRAVAWLSAAAIAIALCLVWDAGAVATALARLAAPLGAIDWPRQHYLAFRNPPTRLAAGQAFEVELEDTAGRLPDEVRIEYRTVGNGGSAATSEPMVRSGDVMVARRENVEQSFAFRAEGGDDDTMPWRLVEVIDPPKLEAFSVTVHPPSYTGLPAEKSDRHLEVIEGSSIEIHGRSTEPLSAARILPPDTQPIVATINPDAGGNKRRAFHVAPGIWIADATGPYRVELADDEGLEGVVGQWNLRVVADSPPSVSWRRPADDLYVTPNAMVPFELLVKDNLAIQRVDLIYERTDRSEAERERRPQEPPIELYRGPATPPPMSGVVGDAHGESRIVEYMLELAPLGLPAGAAMSIRAEAADYRRGVGRTAGSRRIFIVTADEVEARLVDWQEQIVRQLERALAIEQTTREDVRRLEIQQRDGGTLATADRTALQAAELNQRRVGKTLGDPNDGVPALVDGLMAEIGMNRIESTAIRETIDRLAGELQQISTGPLVVAERELTSARKTLEGVALDAAGSDDKAIALGGAQEAAWMNSMSAAGVAQDDVIAALERLIGELSTKVDHRRFVRLITELRLDQLDHQRSARAEIGVQTLPLRLSELSRAQRATLNKAAAGQEALADRYDKIERGMDQLTQQLADEPDEAGDMLSEALAVARRLAIGDEMQEVVRDLSENRVGAALAREAQIAGDLQQVLDVLRNTAERRPEQLVDRLREAEDRLAALREQLAALRRQVAQAERMSAATPEQLAQLNEQQRRLRQQIEQLARQLDRLEAADASQSTGDAARKLNSRADGGSTQRQNASKPAPSNQVQQAESDLEQAANQLAARRQQAEDDLALEFVRRFQAELTDMVERQRQVVERTIDLDQAQSPASRPNDTAASQVAKLADEERQLAQLAKEHSEVLYGLGAVRVSLEDAERRLTAAADLLDRRDTGPPVQQAERRALERLEGMMQAFQQTATDAAQNPGAQPGAGQGAANEQPQRRPTFELLEVKMLRMLQVDLQQRTRDFQKRLTAAANRPPNQQDRAKLQRDAQELAAEQGRLAELVQNMLTRDNEPEE